MLDAHGERIERNLDRLVKMVINQDRIVESWIKLLLAIEAGLIAIIGFLLRPETSAKDLIEPGAVSIIVLVVPAFGIIFAVAIGFIVWWQRKWARWFTRRIMIENLSPGIFPEKEGVIRAEPVGPVTLILVGLVIAICVVWIVVMLALLTA